MMGNSMPRLLLHERSCQVSLRPSPEACPPRKVASLVFQADWRKRLHKSCKVLNSPFDRARPGAFRVVCHCRSTSSSRRFLTLLLGILFWTGKDYPTVPAAVPSRTANEDHRLVHGNNGVKPVRSTLSIIGSGQGW